MEKSCSGCGEVLPIDSFYLAKGKPLAACRECIKRRRREYSAKPEVKASRSQANAIWRAANPEKVKANNSGWYQANKGRTRELDAQWRARNPERYQELRKARWAKWQANNHEAYLESNRSSMRRPERRISRAIWGCLKGRKSGVRWCEMVGYSEQELRGHLERQFLRGMSFESYGEWHIDHIIPLASFVIEGPDDPSFKRAWALTNLRPMWAADNIRKGDKVQTLL